MCVCLCVRLRRERDGGVEDRGGMRECRVRARGPACSVSRRMKNWSRWKSFFAAVGATEKEVFEKSVWGVIKNISLHFGPSYLNSWKPVIALTYSLFFFFFSPSRHLSPHSSFFFSSTSFYSRICLLQTSHLSFFFSVSLPHFLPPRIISAWSRGQLFTSSFLFWPSLPLPLQLIACSLGSKRRHFFSHFMSSLRSLFDPPVRFPSPFIFHTFLQCQSAPSVGPFWTSFFLSLHSHLLLFSLLFCYIPGFSIHMYSFLSPLCEPPPPRPLRVSLVVRCAAGSLLCCWVGTWRWCCAPWTWASAAPARWPPLTCRPSRGPPLAAAAPHRAPWSSGKRRLTLRRLPTQLPRWPQQRRRLLWGQTSGRL